MSTASSYGNCPSLWPWPCANLFPLYSCKTILSSPLSEFCCFRMDPCNFSHCALWFLLSAVSDRSCLFSPCTVISFSPPGHSVFLFASHLSHFQTANVHFLSWPILHRFLKEFSADPHKAMPITFPLLSSSQSTPKPSCFNIKLPHSEMFSLSLPFSHLHSWSGFVQCSAQGSCVLGPQLPWAAGILKKVITKNKIWMKSKVRQQPSSSHCWNSWYNDSKENANLRCHANTRNSKNNSTVRPYIIFLKFLPMPVFSCLFLLFSVFCK